MKKNNEEKRENVMLHVWDTMNEGFLYSVKSNQIKYVFNSFKLSLPSPPQ